MFGAQTFISEIEQRTTLADQRTSDGQTFMAPALPRLSDGQTFAIRSERRITFHFTMNVSRSDVHQ
jgi:Flp pilus assembly CpaF family ATPase